MTPAAATDGRVGTSPRCDAAGRAGASPAVAHPAAEAAAAPALCGWVAPPPPRPAPPLRRVSPASGGRGDGRAAARSGDLPRVSRRARAGAAGPPGLCAGLPRESGAAVQTPGPARAALAPGAHRRSPALPGSCCCGRASGQGGSR